MGAISDCAVTVANALLHHPLPSLDPDATLSFECINTVAKVKQRLSIYWSSLGAYHLATDFPATTTEPQTPCNPYLGHQVLPLWAKNNNDSLLSRQFNSSLSHIIRVYRAAEFEKLNMRPLHFRVEKNMESGPENQTSVDSIIFDAHISKGLKGKVILFVHEKYGLLSLIFFYCLRSNLILPLDRMFVSSRMQFRMYSKQAARY